MAKRNVVKASGAGSNVSAAAAAAPCSASTAAKLIAKLGLTEQQAQMLLEAEEPSADQLAEAAKVNLPAIAAAFSAGTMAAVLAEPGLSTKIDKSDAKAAAARVNLCNDALAPFGELTGRVTAAAKLDAGLLEEFESQVFKQLSARAEVDDGVKKRFAALFAYHHHRFPGRGGKKAGTDQSQAPAAPNKA
ncbi:MAG: hypothetical protein JST54_12730 [Deltaproteobacteria bacterium]|nr:hypothetical protein [Deltaproteobacteria bacterium]